MGTFEILYRKSERHKLNFILEQDKKVQSRARGIDPIFLWPQRARWGWVDNATLWPLHPQERDWVPILQETGWALNLVWMGVWKIVPSTVFDPWIVQPVASSYTNWSIPTHWKKQKGTQILKWIVDNAEIVLNIKIRFVSRFGLPSWVLVVILVRYGSVKFEGSLTRCVAVAVEKILLCCLFLL